MVQLSSPILLEMPLLLTGKSPSRNRGKPLNNSVQHLLFSCSQTNFPNWYCFRRKLISASQVNPPKVTSRGVFAKSESQLFSFSTMLMPQTLCLTITSNDGNGRMLTKWSGLKSYKTGVKGQNFAIGTLEQLWQAKDRKAKIYYFETFTVRSINKLIHSKLRNRSRDQAAPFPKDNSKNEALFSCRADMNWVCYLSLFGKLMNLSF